MGLWNIGVMADTVDTKIVTKIIHTYSIEKQVLLLTQNHDLRLVANNK